MTLYVSGTEKQRAKDEGISILKTIFTKNNHKEVVR